MPLTAEQIQERGKGIGGSEVAAILGVCPYRQPYDIWLQKTGRSEKEDLANVEAVLWGNELEESIAREYCRRQEVKVRKKNQTVRHKKHDWLVANIDRDIVGVRKGLEIKNVGWRVAALWGDDGSDEAAEYYIPQPHHYMTVMDYEAWDLAALIGGQEMRTYHFQRDPEMEELIVEMTHDFWHNHVLKDEPPEIDHGHPKIGDLLKRVFNTVDGEVIHLDERAMEWVNVMQEAKANAKKYSAVADGAKYHLMELVGNAAVAVLPDGTGFTRKKINRDGFTVEPTSYIDFRHTKKLPKGV